MAAFSVTGIAAMFFDIHLSTLSFDGLFEIRQSKTMQPVFVSCYVFGNEPQVQKVMLVGCVWWISICLAC